VQQCILFFKFRGPDGVGRGKVTPRLLRHFNQIGINSYDDKSLRLIFTKILDWHFSRQDFDIGVKAVTEKVITCTILIHKAVCENLLPTPTKSHYTFNLRDFSKVIQGL
jgi:dynein heavy chain